jgi:cysteine desulfurase/selenocysteine lyase
LSLRASGALAVGKGDEIIVSTEEHHSDIVPWQMLAQRVGAHLRVIPVNDAGELLLDEYQRLLSPRTKIVAVTHVSNALGTINDVKEIARLAHRAGAKVLVDGAQWVAHFPPTSARSTAISTSSRAISSTDRQGSACSTGSVNCSKPCRRTWAAAT